MANVGISDISWFDVLSTNIKDPAVSDALRNLVRNLELLVAQAIDATNLIVLTEDVTNADVTPDTLADVTGLSFPVLSGELYQFRFFIHYAANAVTTGSRWSVNGPATTILSYRSEYGFTRTSRTFNEGLSGYDLPASSNATSPAAAASENIAVVEGLIEPSANGDVIARFASEVTAAAIVAKAGSFVQYRRLK